MNYNFNNYNAKNEISIIRKLEKETIENGYRLSTGTLDSFNKRRITFDLNRGLNQMAQATEEMLKLTNPIYA